MRKYVRNGVLFLLLDAVIRLVFEAEIHNIMGKTRYSPVLARTPVERLFEMDWSQSACIGCYRYDCWFADVREI